MSLTEQFIRRKLRQGAYRLGGDDLPHARRDGFALTQRNGFGGAGARRRSGVGPSYLIDENFTAGTEPTGWSVIAGTPTYSGSLVVPATSTEETVAFTAQDNVWIYFTMSHSATPSANLTGFSVYNGATLLAYLSFRTVAGTVRCYHGTGNSSTTGWTVASTFHVWMNYIKGTGANGVWTVYRSTDGTRGTALTSVTAGTSTLAADRLRFSGGSGCDITFDNVKVSATEIGDNP